MTKQHAQISNCSVDTPAPVKENVPTNGSMATYISSSQELVTFAMNFESHGQLTEALELYMDALTKLQTVCTKSTIPKEREQALALVGGCDIVGAFASSQHRWSFVFTKNRLLRSIPLYTCRPYQP